MGGAGGAGDSKVAWTLHYMRMHIVTPHNRPARHRIPSPHPRPM
ncbi:hypothetical protein SBD_7887 [Streptomyces bottropensis ATCC 25435]|uniref:Uncharacterized protein n=1 Tax=Streptomyces bottropensis ATCC 25435 TaxID=1054862 RepID=M3FEC7_9ACTN|nr:hypothetical protein SBD_7887 [Streptomyces bottropensis ATCC 25435]